MKIREARAHCDIPCAVYDPAVSQYAALSVLRFLDLIAEMPDSIESKKDLAHLTRLVQQKEEHAIEVKDAVRTIWGDYFKEPQIKFFPKIHELVHSIMLSASKCKQELDVKNGLDLLNLLNQFSEIFWESKGFETELVKAPHPPSLGMTKPILDNV